jgi:hypothetical protein
MEKTKMSYQNGKIYAIRSYQTDDVYYGSTTQSLSKRLSKHKESYKYWKNGKYHYVSSFEVIKLDDCYIELVEDYPCNSKSELERREGQIIRAHDDAINQRVAGRTGKEWRMETVDTKKQYDMQYRKDNKEKIKLLKNTKYNCECGGKYVHCAKAQHLRTIKHTNYLESIQA